MLCVLLLVCIMSYNESSTDQKGDSMIKEIYIFEKLQEALVLLP